ncbi:hypothetical protein [Sphingomonas prati]|uniref:Uncharacterized protein n=1 Tax=Sphingomonas prati TaxID=1843237 RepID=A0A7W9F470_9SPHN|nr:hypothetical protein [Sphingomonas prati]MBB5730609.1 hypothetical protein [Sphingomonas prati]GGE95358.1 hypothetical protein GCM10011404_30610 [Sphingomonas prati]
MSIPFDIPAELMLRYYAGNIVRSGALLREVGSGQIVAHLQEATGLVQMAGKLDPFDVVEQGIQVYQNEQIKAGLALVQGLGIANLALTGISIGVSVVGFAIVAARLGRIEKGMDGLAAAIERVSRKVDGMRDYLVRQELADLRAELRRIDAAWASSEEKVQIGQWREAAGRLLTIEERFHGHARALATAGEEPGLRDLMTDAYVLAADGRRSALLAAGDETAAEDAGREFGRALGSLTGPLGTAQLLREMMTAEPGKGLAARAEAVERLRPKAEARAATLREREEMAATAPLTIAALRQAGVSGRDWLKRARNENRAPLICLPV